LDNKMIDIIDARL